MMMSLDEWAHLWDLALGNSCVTTKPLIFYELNLDQDTQLMAAQLGKKPKEMSVLMDFGNAPALLYLMSGSLIQMPSYENRASIKILEHFAQQKRNMYEKACLKWRKDFTPVCYSVDGLPCKAVRAEERHLTSLLSDKWDRQYSEMVNFIRSQMSLSVVWSNILFMKMRGPTHGTGGH
ncbi:hypothetical protein ACHAW6_004588 [Cyclotella cf. meneghiniana]